jgi:hypothetical protein
LSLGRDEIVIERLIETDQERTGVVRLQPTPHHSVPPLSPSLGSTLYRF